MPSRLQFVLAATAFVVVVALPVAYSATQIQHRRNLRVVEEGVLYRCGQLTPAGLDRVIREYGIRTVVTLRTTRTAAPPPDSWEVEFCNARGVNHRRIVPRVWGPDEDGDIPAEDAVREFLEVLDKRENYPVLVHCFAGIHRTGTMCAVYRMEYAGWSPERAMREMHHMGFEPADMHEHIRDYLTKYKPRKK